ncbi:MAG: recombinase family protein [Peptococcaceae bacterium]|nr:recombinase family protein [Peptococcaceae bacterium]
MRVAFYGRVSTEEQADRGNITGQVEFARKYFELHGRAENIDGYEMYLDEGVSGAIPLEERPEGARLLADARAGKISAVYFYRLDRLARSTQVVLSTYNELEKLNISIKSMTEAFDTGTPVGKFFMTLLASIAALERDTILERTQMGKERKAREGCWTSGPPPFGYRIGADKRLVVHNPEAETVRLIFRLYNEGMSMVPLAGYLNARGVPTPTASKKNKKAGAGLWHAGHISLILRNTVYMGEYRTMRRSKKKKSPDMIRVPAIVSAHEFNRAGRLLAENGQAVRGFRGRRYLLRGIIYCGHCGLAMIGNSGGGGRFYYRCAGTVNRGRGRSCGNKQVRAAYIEQAVWSDIRDFICSPGRVVEKIRVLLERDHGDMEPVERELDLVDRALEEKKSARARILSMVSRLLITDREAENELNRLAAEVSSLSRRRDTLLSRRIEIQAARNHAADSALLLEKLSRRIDQLPPSMEVVRLLVERVVVKTEAREGKRVSRAEVHYRFRPGVQTGPGRADSVPPGLVSS